jgi:hypothetical protein
MSTQTSIQRQILILIVLLTGIFVNPATLSGQGTTRIDMTQNWDKEENFLLTELAASISYIPLETSKECLLPKASMSSIRLTTDYILVITEAQPIHIFSRAGKFLWKIGTIGGGPREVPNFNNVVINDEKNWIAIRGFNKVVMYSLKGEFLREFPIDREIGKIFKGNDGQILGLMVSIKDTLNTSQSLQFLSEQGKVIKTLPLFKPETSLMNVYADMMRCQVFWMNGKLNILEYPYRNCYEMDEAGNWQSRWNLLLPAHGESQIGSVYEMAGHLFIYGSNPFVHLFVAPLALGKARNCHFLIDGTRPDITGLYNDLDGGLPFWPRSSICNNQVANLVDATHIIDYAQGKLATFGGQAPKMQDTFKKLGNSLHYDDNPVVAIITLK